MQTCTTVARAELHQLDLCLLPAPQATAMCALVCVCVCARTRHARVCVHVGVPCATMLSPAEPSVGEPHPDQLPEHLGYLPSSRCEERRRDMLRAWVSKHRPVLYIVCTCSGRSTDGGGHLGHCSRGLHVHAVMHMVEPTPRAL